MGQTLPNGIYLPAEGERNCYDGLEGNWRSLDSLISTVAGKASATHTHGNISSDGKVGTTANLPLITGTGGVIQAGSFGSAANTFCEGNDSRLSDARTPVAHTHTKSDVTDLLNSNFIPSANNSYDLGSSSYQWNNLYAKNYYYNGTAWGLDKANTWSAENTFLNTLSITGNTLFTRDRPQVTVGTIPSSSIFYGVTRFRDSNNNSFALERGTISSIWNYRKWFVYNFSDASMYSAFEIGIKHDGSEKYFLIDSDKLIPYTTGFSDLGTSTNKWKSFNGVNPGALSFPMPNNTENADWIDISSYITNLSGSRNSYTPTVSGWVAVLATDAADASIFILDNANRFCSSVYGNGTQGTGRLAAILPINANHRCDVYIKAAALFHARFYPCQGNV